MALKRNDRFESEFFIQTYTFTNISIRKTDFLIIQAASCNNSYLPSKKILERKMFKSVVGVLFLFLKLPMLRTLMRAHIAEPLVP